MVGIVIVSHSQRVADAVADLARHIVGLEAEIETVGGADDPSRPDGPDPARIVASIERASDPEGVVVLTDLGNAVRSALVARSLLDPVTAARVVFCEAPLVEGAVAAVAAASIGATLAEVAAEARSSLAPKIAFLADGAGPGTAVYADADVGSWTAITIVVTNPMGLHARPATRFVQTAAAFDAEIVVDNLSTGAGPARARSLTDVATLGASQGHQVRVRARGSQAAQALDALLQLAARGFDDAQVFAGPAVVTRPVVHDLAQADPGAIRGLAVSPGVAVGPARRLRRGPPRPREQGTPQTELAALRAALDRASGDLQVLRDTLARQAGEAHATMLDAQLALLGDDALLDPARTAIARGQRAEAAWDAAVAGVAQRFAELDDSYLRARADDVREVGRRILDHLMGMGATTVLRGPGILIAGELGVAQTASLDMAMVQGIAVATGSPTSHAAILARALGVPAVVDAGEMILTIAEEMELMVDGDAGTITIAPSDAAIAAAERAQSARVEATERSRRDAVGPAVTRDGIAIEVAANINGPDEAFRAAEGGAAGVGLFRTEFLFMNRPDAPSEDEQHDAYAAAAAAFGDRPLIIRTLDAGADKPVVSYSQPAEENPFLGRRGIRLSLAHPELLAVQLRAILRAGADHANVAVMFPMVATLAELHAARAALVSARAELERRGISTRSPQVGIMIEVPSAALLADVMASQVDFVSIGTNDLTQYVMAAERGNPAVADLADAAHPAVLRLIAQVCQAAATQGCRVAVCGEAAADPEIAPVLMGLGVRELSVSPAAIGQVKGLVRTLDTVDVTRLAADALACVDGAQVRRLVRASRS